MRDHPRVCGEHSWRWRSLSVSMGSSPRMRGARVLLAQDDLAYGIIPAYAGSTATLRTPHQTNRDHPRVCGEHLLFSLVVKYSVGSSPRMRGAQPERDSFPVPDGIIPAYAGSTRQRDKPTRLARDHPRVCGEHITNIYRNSA